MDTTAHHGGGNGALSLLCCGHRHGVERYFKKVLDFLRWWDDDDGMTNYDEDFSDPRQHCQHGTFIGSWWGPDYMCGWCEDGVSVAEMHEALAMQATYRAERAEAAYNRLIAVLETVPFNAALATTLVEMTQRGHSFA